MRLLGVCCCRGRRQGVDPEAGTGNVLSRDTLSQGEIRRNLVGLAVTACMIEMQADRIIANVTCLHAGIHESYAKLAIKSAPLHAFIEPTGCD